MSKRRRKKRRQIDPQKLKQRRHKVQLRALFARLGFERQAIDGLEFTFGGRTGELDDLFIYENIVVLCEYTVGKATSAHVLKKKPLFDNIAADAPGWINHFGQLHTALPAKLQQAGYRPEEAKIRIIYASTEGVSKEIVDACPGVAFLDGTRERYFQALSKTIQRSARHELFKFLDIPFAEIGQQVHRSSSQQLTFDGAVLPEGHSSFPKGFKVVSFYADPGTLLELSYVLRQDSWRDTEGLYQRILIPSKIRKMRKYLVEIKRVFVNNIIVTLPSNTSLNDPRARGQNIDVRTLQKVTPVSVQIPYHSNVIGLVDGQHRVFCYYESNDKIEPTIAQLRKRQNLLVTGLIFPTNWTEHERRRFEAKLFLEINDTQARAKSGLKQSIELVLNPLSTTAIAKEITNRLSHSGPLQDLLQVSVFDPPGRIKTTSIVSYGLRPLVKFAGDDTLFATWSSAGKNRLKNAEDTSDEQVRRLLDQYLIYCVYSINEFLLAAKLKLGPDRWRIEESRKTKGLWLSPTTINGLFVCMRQIVAHRRLKKRPYYERRLQGLASFGVGAYRSSQWNALGQKLFETFFE